MKATKKRRKYTVTTTTSTKKRKANGVSRFYDESYPPRTVYANGTKIGLLQSKGKKVWFVIPKHGPVTVDWVFTGKKQQTSRKDALAIYTGLMALGFERVV